ncbi:MAG: bactofilin family protein [Hyphomicrobiales bacterium]
MALFAKDKPDAAPSGAERSDHETAFFGAKLSVKGKVSGSGNLIVMGKLEGEFDLNGELVVAPPAVLNGEIKAVNVTVSGNVTGNLTAREKIHLEKSAVVSGRLNTPRLSVADGASFNGDIEMKKPAEAAPASKRTAQK